MRRALWVVVPAVAVLAAVANGSRPGAIRTTRSVPVRPDLKEFHSAVVESGPAPEKKRESPGVLPKEIPRPRPETEGNWRSLREWLLDELTDAEFARLLRGTEIETYFAKVVAGLLEGPHEAGTAPPEFKVFLDRFNERVSIAESR